MSKFTDLASRSWSCFEGDHRFDVQVQQVLVDPPGSVASVTCQRHGLGQRLAGDVHQVLVGRDHHLLEGGGFVSLIGGQVKRQRVAVAIAEEVELSA